MDESSSGTSTSDAKQDQISFDPTPEIQPNYYSIVNGASSASCEAIPLNSTTLITLADCVAQCDPDQLCTSAVMYGQRSTLFDGQNQDSQLIGLVTSQIIHPLYQPEFRHVLHQMGQESFLYQHSYDLAVLFLDSEVSSTRTLALYPERTLSFGGQEALLDQLYASGLSTVWPNLDSNSLCTHYSSPLLNAENHVVGLHFGGEGCGSFLRLDTHSRFIEDALNGRLNLDAEFYKSSDSLSPPSNEYQTLVDEYNQEEDTSDETDRNDEPKVSCVESINRYDNTWCEGQVMVECKNAELQYLDCASFGKQCEEIEDWYAMCVN
jgi:hypothetical protein